MPFTIIVGVQSRTNAIGFAGKIPWKCREDMKFFRETTTKTKNHEKTNAVVMGRKTFESLPAPLPNRLNVVLTRNMKYDKQSDNVIFSNNFEEIIAKLESNPDIETIFVIGGEMIYREAIYHPKCEKIYLNKIDVEVAEADSFFPEIDEDKYVMVESTIVGPNVMGFLFERI